MGFTSSLYTDTTEIWDLGGWVLGFGSRVGAEVQGTGAGPPGSIPGIYGRGAARAEDAQGTPTQSHISPSILVYEE